jgi:hypothetical protein
MFCKCFFQKQTPGFPLLVSPNAISLVFPEETAGKHVSNSSFPQKDHLLPAVPALTRVIRGGMGG